MTNTPSTPELIVLALCEIAIVRGDAPIRDKIWNYRIDKDWTVKANGHVFEREGVPALSFAIDFRGVPAGLLSALGEGIIATDHKAKIADLVDAVSSALKKERRTNAS